MIRYDLLCRNDHAFEGWFQDSAAYDAQRKLRKVTCPICGSAKVEKQIMAPSVGRNAEAQREAQKEAAKALAKVQRYVEENCEYVGERFPEEARRIHYGESDPRGIYGEASAEDARELSEEGVPFAQLPMRKRADS